MDKLFFKLFLIILLWIWTFVYVFPWHSYNINMPFTWKDYKLGLDLEWWVELDYKVDLEEVKKEENYNSQRENSILEWLKSIIDKRVEALKISDSIITTANYGWEKHIIVQIPLKWTSQDENNLNIKKAKEAIWKVMKIEFKELDLEATQNNINQDKNLLIWKPAQDSMWRILDDRYFIKSSVQYNWAFQPMVELTFNTEWAEIFWELTTRLKWKQIAIFVWWEMLTSPTVNDVILTWKAVITWTYTPAEAQQLSNDINTWVVPAPIYLTSERSIDAKLWLNSLEKLITAWIYWFLLIMIFLILVYRLYWFMSGIALFIYILIVLAIVKAFWFVLTLASIAWLILSIGIAIDANILIFERIKDELKSWNQIDKAIKKWFEKSWSAIWDSNLTWLIISIILFIFWINMIKWFGLMLWIWIIVSLFNAMFISRLLILLVSRKPS